MQKFIDITGQKFERWTVIKPTKNKNGIMWKCVCECGNIGIVQGGSLRNRRSKSCGCLKNDIVRQITIQRNTTHNLSETKAHSIWKNMKNRCLNKNYNRFKNYGGRGIKVCDRWKNSFANFFQDTGECPQNYSIERINVNGNYCPENCKWILFSEQAKNKRNTKRI